MVKYSPTSTGVSDYFILDGGSATGGALGIRIVS